MASDDYRPRFHFTPATGWLNDPNGLVFFEDEYHLFYQANPDDIEGDNADKHWGHAVGPDLLRWTHLPPSLAPDHLGAIWSGSAVVDWHDTSGFFDGGAGLVAIFTHWRSGAQSQSLAYSRDRGRAWTTYAGNPVLPDPGLKDFRDPKVFWHAPTASWVMVLAAGTSVRFYASPDLKTWRQVGEFADDRGVLARTWECPDLFPLPIENAPGRERWVLVVSLNPTDVPAMVAFVGDFDGATFTPERATDAAQPIEAGPDFYAAVSWSDVPPEDGRRLWVGWMGNWRYARNPPTAAWRGALSIPRELRLREFADGTRLVQHPVAELRRLRAGSERRTDLAIPAGVTPVPAARGTALEIEAEFAPGTAGEFGLHVHAGGGQQTVVAYDLAAQQLVVDRGASGNADFSATFGGRFAGPLAPVDGRVRLHVFVDRCSVEVFADDGRLVLTTLIFPDEAHDGVALFATGGEATATELTVHRLDPA